MKQLIKIIMEILRQTRLRQAVGGCLLCLVLGFIKLGAIMSGRNNLKACHTLTFGDIHSFELRSCQIKAGKLAGQAIVRRFMRRKYHKTTYGSESTNIELCWFTWHNS